jgi:hypothetical protein
MVRRTTPALLLCAALLPGCWIYEQEAADAPPEADAALPQGGMASGGAGGEGDGGTRRHPPASSAARPTPPGPTTRARTT